MAFLVYQAITDRLGALEVDAVPATARNLNLFGELIATETAHDNSANGINSERKRRKGRSLSNTRLEASSMTDSGPEAPRKCSKCAQMLAPLRFSNVTCQCKK